MINLNEVRILIIENEQAVCKAMHYALVDIGFQPADRIYPSIASFDSFYEEFGKCIDNREKFLSFIANYICKYKINYLIIDLHLRNKDSKSNFNDTMGFKLIEDLVSNVEPIKLINDENYLYFAIPKLIVSGHPSLDILIKEHKFFVTDFIEKYDNIDSETLKNKFINNNVFENIKYNVSYFDKIQSLNQGSMLYEMMKKMNNKIDQIILKVDDVADKIIEDLNIKENTVSQKEIEDVINFKLPFLLGEINLNALYKKVDDKFMKLGITIQNRTL